MLTFAVGASAQDKSKEQAGMPALPAQLPAATVKEQLSDGSFIVVIEGVAYKAISADVVRGIIQTGEELDKARRVRAKLENQIADLEANETDFKEVVRVAREQREEEAGIALNFKTLYEGEKALRIDAEKLHGSPGKVTSLLNHPVVRLAKEVAVPIAQTWLTARIQNNTTVVMTGEQLALLQAQQRGRPMFVQLR